MGKAAKKTTPQVKIAATAAPAKPLKKGKREAEEVIEKEVSKKKQKKDVIEKEESKKKGVQEVIVKKVYQRKQKRKNTEGETEKKKGVKIQESSRDDSSKSEEKVIVKEASEKNQKKRKTEKIKVVNKQDSSDHSSKYEEEVIVKEVSQKKQENKKTETKTVKKKAETKTQKKKAMKKQETSDESSSSSSSSESEDDQKNVAMKEVAPYNLRRLLECGDGVINGKVGVAAKNGPVSVSKNKEESGEDFKSKVEDSSNSDENVTASKKVPDAAAAAAAIKNVKGSINKKNADNPDSEKDDSSKEDTCETKKGPAAKNGPVSVSKNKEEFGEDSKSKDEDCSDSDENVTASKKVPGAAIKNMEGTISKKDVDDFDSEKDSSSKEQDTCETKKGPAARNGPVSVSKNKEEFGEDSKSKVEDSSDPDENVTASKKVPASAAIGYVDGTINKKDGDKSDSEKDSSSKEQDTCETKKGPATKTENVPVKKGDGSSGDSDSEDMSFDDNPSAKKVSEAASKIPSLTAIKKKEESNGDTESDVVVTDVEMVDVLPKETDVEKSSLSSEKDTRPVFTQSKTLYVGNLSFSVEKTDVEDLFKDYGDLVDVRFGIRHDGAFKGYGHVEFATAEAARKACDEKNGTDLLGRPLKLDIADEKKAYPYRNFQKVHGIDRPTVYVRGFDRSSDEQAVKDGLKKHFSCCGEISRISLPRDDSGLKGFAYIDFTNSNDVTNALLLNKSHLNEFMVIVEAARPRDQNGGNGGGGGRFNDQRGNGGGRFGDRGGRFGYDQRGGGRFGDRGGRFDHDQRGSGGGRFGDRGGHRGGRFVDRGRGRGTPN